MNVTGEVAEICLPCAEMTKIVKKKVNECT